MLVKDAEPKERPKTLPEILEKLLPGTRLKMAEHAKDEDVNLPMCFLFARYGEDVAPGFFTGEDGIKESEMHLPSYLPLAPDKKTLEAQERARRLEVAEGFLRDTDGWLEYARATISAYAAQEKGMAKEHWDVMDAAAEEKYLGCVRGISKTLVGENGGAAKDVLRELAHSKRFAKLGSRLLNADFEEQDKLFTGPATPSQMGLREKLKKQVAEEWRVKIKGQLEEQRDAPKLAEARGVGDVRSRVTALLSKPDNKFADDQEEAEQRKRMLSIMEGYLSAQAAREERMRAKVDEKVEVELARHSNDIEAEVQRKFEEELVRQLKGFFMELGVIHLNSQKLPQKINEAIGKRPSEDKELGIYADSLLVSGQQVAEFAFYLDEAFRLLEVEELSKRFAAIYHAYNADSGRVEYNFSHAHYDSPIAKLRMERFAEVAQSLFGAD